MINSTEVLDGLRKLALDRIGPDDALEPMAAYYHDPDAYRPEWWEQITPQMLLNLIDIAVAAQTFKEDCQVLRSSDAAKRLFGVLAKVFPQK